MNLKKRVLRAKLVHKFNKPVFTIEVWQDGNILLNSLEDYYVFTSLEESINFINNNYE